MTNGQGVSHGTFRSICLVCCNNIPGYCFKWQMVKSIGLWNICLWTSEFSNGGRGWEHHCQRVIFIQYITRCTQGNWAAINSLYILYGEKDIENISATGVFVLMRTKNVGKPEEWYCRRNDDRNRSIDNDNISIMTSKAKVITIPLYNHLKSPPSTPTRFPYDNDCLVMQFAANNHFCE